MEVVIRPALVQEVARLGDVERDGDRRFAGYVGVPVGFDDTVDVSRLEVARTEGRLWVASRWSGGVGRGASDDGEIIGFALAETLDGEAHLAQVSVGLEFQGRGVGGRLIEAVCRWARERALGSVTLSTFTDVGWNRPLYEHLGFVVVPEEQWTTGMRVAMEREAALGLDGRRRVVMRKFLPTR
jgi:GNAT superfamily N-acetyltransferase